MAEIPVMPGKLQFVVFWHHSCLWVSTEETISMNKDKTKYAPPTDFLSSLVPGV